MTSKDVPVERKLSAMVNAIEKNDLVRLRLQLSDMKDSNISEPMVKTVLPKKYRKVAGPVTTTPLRVAITWRNLDAFKLVLGSDCIISEEDRALALQKICRRIEGDVEIEIVELLLQRSSTVPSPVHYTIAIENLINEGKEYHLRRLLEVHFSPKVTTQARGFLCLALASKGRSTTEDTRSTYFLDTWRDTARSGMIGLLRTGFNLGQFLLSSEYWFRLESKYFHTIVCLLPLFIQVSTEPCLVVLAAILRRASRDFWYPMLRDNERSVLHALPKLLWYTRYDLNVLLKTACLSPKFENHLGFNDWKARKNGVRPLQDLCRHTIRASFNVNNVLEGIEKVPFFPKKLKDYMLYKDCLDDCDLGATDYLCLSL